MTDTPKRQPLRVTCTRCRRDEPVSVEPDPAAGEALAGWHQTETGWVCDHCWTELDRRGELGLCRLCGRAPYGHESASGREWRHLGEGGELICPECHFAGRDSVTIQLTKESVRRWEQAGVLARFQGVVNDTLERERKMITAMLHEQVEREGVTPSHGEWESMLASAVEAARQRWPKPIGQS